MAEADNNKEIEPETTANGQQPQPQSRGIGQRLRGLLRRKDRGQQQKERPDDAVKLGCGGLFRRKKRADDGEDAQKPTEKPKKSKDIKGGIVKEEEQQAEQQQAKQQPDDPATKPGPSGEQPTKTAPARPQNPPRPLLELATESAERTVDKEAQKKAETKEAAEEKAVEEKALEEKAAEEKTAEEKAVEEKAAEEAAEEKAAEEKTEEEKAAEEKTGEEKAAEVVEKAAEEKAAEKTVDRNGASNSDDESERERRKAAERQFEQISVDMSSVAAKPGVKVEQGPHAEMWSNIVNKSFIGTGAFKRAAVCSLESGAVLACNPADFTPTVEQVAALRNNFDCRSVFSAAGFGLADTVYSLLEEVGSKDILCGQDDPRGQTVLVCKTKTALLAAACQGAPDRAADMLGDMRQHFISQGM